MRNQLNAILGLLGWVIVSLASAQTIHADETAERPNIIFLLADDLGYGDLGCYGRRDLKTPRLDQLAAEGVRFTAHYANGPECSPTRAAFMTGRYQQWIGGLECAIGTGNVGRYDDAIRLRETHDLGLPTTTPTIVRMLKDAGYATAITGKWHLGYEPKFAPHLHGFDQAFYCIGGGMDYFHYLDTVAGYNLFRDGKPISGEGYFTDMLTDEAIQFIQQERSSPYFLYVPFTCPHSPFQGPGDYQKNPLPLDDPLWSQGKAPPNVYRAMIERMDQCVGRIVDAVEAAGDAESKNTLIVFAGDNGGTASARNAPFSGFKGGTLEGGIRVPAIARWPGQISPQTVCDQPCITFDFTRSFAALAGVDESKTKRFEGIDLIQHVISEAMEIERSLYWRKPRGEQIWKGLREGDMKYVARVNGSSEEEFLYDLAADPSEQSNLSQQQSELLQRMREKYNQWETTTRANRRGRPVH